MCLIRICFSHQRLPELNARFSSFWLKKEAGTMPHFMGSRRTKCDIDYIPDSDDQLENPITTDNTSSDASLQAASTWLQNCVKHHRECNTNGNGDPWYPTRLLDVDDPANDGTYVRLIRTAEELPLGPYATLSHRWGSTNHLQLTGSISRKAQVKFMIADMPRTFQEAVKVSKQLGIRYLWIDSLCIVQDKDDLRDWQREASLMGNVYSHSHCNLSAVDTEDSSGGLFRSRKPRAQSRVSVKVDLADIQRNSGVVICIMTDIFLWRRSISDSPLNSRGWVFQERLLAPRILHFGRRQLFWECGMLGACESFPKGLSMTSYRSMTYDFIKLWVTEHHSISPFRFEDDYWLNFWEDAVVLAYTQTSITVPSDKLIALSGIAKLVVSRLRCTYVAGMWREHLERTLMWRVCDTTASRPKVYVAPSWSWASLDGNVRAPPRGADKYAIHVEDVVLEHATEDVTGAVASGWLDVRGCLKPMKLQRFDHKYHGTPWSMTVNQDVAREQDKSTEDSEQRDVPIPIYVELDIAPTSDSEFDDDNEEGNLFFMPVSEPQDRAVQHSLSLMLRLVDKATPSFQRIGVIETLSDQAEGRKQLWKELDGATKARLPCLRYENGLHTIRII